MAADAGDFKKIGIELTKVFCRNKIDYGRYPKAANALKDNTVQLRIFGTNFRPVETRNFASLPRFLGLTELYCPKR